MAGMNLSFVKKSASRTKLHPTIAMFRNRPTLKETIVALEKLGNF